MALVDQNDLFYIFTTIFVLLADFTFTANLLMLC